MASIYAELHVAGRIIPILRFQYEASQATDQRGRVVAKVVRGLLHATADVPDQHVLPEWASQPQKRLPAQLVVLDNGAAVETLTFPAAYCVGYHEVFRSGDDHQGAYVCHFTLSDPDGWTWERGRAMPYVAPAAREHGGPGAALVSGGPALAPPAAAWAAA